MRCSQELKRLWLLVSAKAEYTKAAIRCSLMCRLTVKLDVSTNNYAARTWADSGRMTGYSESRLHSE